VQKFVMPYFAPPFILFSFFPTVDDNIKILLMVHEAVVQALFHTYVERTSIVRFRTFLITGISSVFLFAGLKDYGFFVLLRRPVNGYCVYIPTIIKYIAEYNYWYCRMQFFRTIVTIALFNKWPVGHYLMFYVGVRSRVGCIPLLWGT